LQGQLNEHALALAGELLLRDSALQSLALELRSGDNLLQLQGELQPALALTWTLDAPTLSQLHAALGGLATGSGELAGSVDAPVLTGALQGSALAYSRDELRLSLRELQLDGSTGVDGNALGLQFGGLVLQRAGEATTVIETASVRLEGSPAAHELTLLADGMETTISLAVSGALQGATWQGQMLQAGWTLRFPWPGRMLHCKSGRIAGRERPRRCACRCAHPLPMALAGSSICATCPWHGLIAVLQRRTSPQLCRNCRLRGD
jgi:translocation and assembly module TamB